MDTQELERAHLKVEGMTCNHCASTVDGIIKQEGGKDVHVDYLMGEASFDALSDEKIERILTRLKSAGYKAQAEMTHDDHTGLSTVEKRFFFTLPFSLVLFAHMFVPAESWLNIPWVQMALCLPVFVIGLYHFGKSTLEAIKSGTINMDVLILLGSSSAFFYSLYGALISSAAAHSHKYLFFETTSTIITLVLLGYVIEHRAVKRTTSVLRELFKATPEKAKKLVQSGLNQDLVVVNVNELRPDDLILINAGDRVPADGIILHGEVQVNQAMLTGEADLVSCKKDGQVLSGSIVDSGNATVRVVKAGNESTMGQIIDLVKKSRADKPSVQKLADRISSWFVPSIIGIALIAFLVNYFGFSVEIGESILRSIAVLVIACPCAMGLATPTAVSVGLGLSAKLGIIVKKASVFEEITALDTLVFDKTGTLTTGDLQFVVQSVRSLSMEEALGIIRSLEMHSNHPIATKLYAFTEGVEEIPLDDISETPGKGMSATMNGKQIRFGTSEFAGYTATEFDLILTIDGSVVAEISIQDSVKPDASDCTSYLSKEHGLIILSGDVESKTKEVASQLGIKNYHFRQLPEQKLAVIEGLKSNQQVGMIGDGINDSPSLAKADVGISMGNANALAAESSKVVLIGDSLKNLSRLFKISNAVVRTIRQNLFWAFAYNIVAVPMAAMGYLDPMVAALSMAFSDVVVIGNSLRLRMILPSTTV